MELQQDVRFDAAEAAAVDGAIIESLARPVKHPLPAEPKPRRRDIGGPFAWDVVH